MGGCEKGCDLSPPVLPMALGRNGHFQTTHILVGSVAGKQWYMA